MSWQGSCKTVPRATPEEVDQALAAMVIDNGRELTSEAQEGVRGAKECAKQLLYSDAFGPLPHAAGTGYLLSISGHSNPGHRPTEGWSGDCVTVSVQQLPPA